MPVVIGETSGVFLLKCMSMMAECTGSRPMEREQSKNVNKESAVISDGYKSKSYDRKRQNKRTCRRAKTFHRQYGRCKFMRGSGRSWRRPAIKVVPGPKNTTGTFFFGTEVVDFCRGRGLTFWIGAEMSGGYPYAYAYIY